MDLKPRSATIAKFNQRFGEERITTLNKVLVPHLVKTNLQIHIRPVTTTCDGASRRAPRDTRELEFLSLRIPVEILNSTKGSKIISIQRDHLAELLGVSYENIARLQG